MTLGRAPDCDLRIPEDAQGADTVSRYHARFEKRGERWAVIDGVEEGKLSTNGIYVNGKRTLENYLTDNDEIACGEVKFRFHAQPTNVYPAEGGQQ
jgi:pSer/pThr/pTyr-binding forkhead associated (FHA) protein